VKVSELIEALRAMPQDSDVWCLWDGGLRTEAAIVYLARCGCVALADYAEVCYGDEDRPVDAPSAAEEKYWYTQQEPE
jgi:hypothetical protein